MTKKVFPAFDIEIGQHRLSTDQRAKLKQEFHLEFTEQDFADMEAALDACHGAYDALQIAPTLAGLQASLNEIARAAQTLWGLLHPVGPLTESANLGASSGPDLSAAYEAANRVTFAFFPPIVEHADELEADTHERLEATRLFRDAAARFDAFTAILLQIPAIAATIAPSLAWSEISERGTAHIYYLREGLERIRARHDQQKRYTRSDLNVDESGHPIKVEPRSFMARLAFRLGQLLPSDARPTSVGAIIVQMTRDRKKPEQETGK